MVEDAPDDGGAVPAPWWARWVAGVMVGVLLVAFVVPIRFALWPVTSWELFSRPRSAEQATYVAEVVGPDGSVAPVPFSRLGPGYRRWLTIARTFPVSSPAQRTRVCEDWADAAAGLLGRDEVAEVRVVRVVKRAAPRVEDPPVPVARSLSVRCRPR